MGGSNNKCPHCGEDIPIVNGKPAQFCMNCGTKIAHHDTNAESQPQAKKEVSNVEKVKQLEREAKAAKNKAKKDPKNKKKTYIILGAIALFVLIIVLISTGSKDKEGNISSQSSSANYKLYIDIKYKENLLLNKYDVDVYLDNEEIGTIKQGEVFTHLLDVTSGQHEIKFSKTDDDSVDGTEMIDVYNDTTFSCMISSSSSSISITDVNLTDSIDGSQMEVPELRGMNLKEALDNLKKAGFTNIISEPQEDSSINDESDWVIVAQNKIPGTIIDKNDRFIVSSIKDANFNSLYSKDDVTGNYYRLIDNCTGGIAFQYPSYYSVNDSSRGVEKYLYPKEKDFYATLIFDTCPLTSLVKDTDNVPSKLEELLKKELKLDKDKTKSVLSSKEISVAGLPAWRIDLTMGDDITGKSRQTAVFIANTDKNSLVEVSLGHNENDESNYRYDDDLNEILETAIIDESFKGFDKEPEKASSTVAENGGKTDVDNAGAKAITEEPEVYTVDNCEDLANLFALEAVSPDEQQKFINKYLGKKIEFDAIIYQSIPNPDYSTIFDYIIVPGKDADSGKCVLFYLENLNYSGFNWDMSKKLPDILLPGTLIRLQGEVKKGSDPAFIYLKPTKSWGR